MGREELPMPDIPKEASLALYAHFDEIYARLIRARGITLGPGSVDELVIAINEANEYASQMEDLWSTVLALEEMATFVECDSRLVRQLRCSSHLPRRRGSGANALITRMSYER
jgi:hypothetical protein